MVGTAVVLYVNVLSSSPPLTWELCLGEYQISQEVSRQMVLCNVEGAPALQ